MRISLSARISYKEDGATKTEKYSKPIDTDELNERQIKDEFIQIIKGFVKLIQESGTDMNLSAVDFDEFFEGEK